MITTTTISKTYINVFDLQTNELLGTASTRTELIALIGIEPETRNENNKFDDSNPDNINSLNSIDEVTTGFMCKKNLKLEFKF